MISILFIVASLVVMEQMRFVNQKDLGFDPKGLIQLSGFVDVSGKIESTLMQELSALPQVKSFTDTNFKPQHHVDPMAIFTMWNGRENRWTQRWTSTSMEPITDLVRPST